MDANATGSGTGDATSRFGYGQSRHRRQQSSRTTTSNNPPPVSKQLASRLDGLRKTRMEVLPDARRQITVTGAAVLAAHAEVMERTIQVLERTKHGALARAGRARAEHLAKVAEGMEGKVRFVLPFLF